MIRKIPIQDVTSKSASERGAENDSSRRERDYLIERLTRKRSSVTTSEVPTKTKKASPRRRKGFDFKIFRSEKKWIWLSIPVVFILLAFVVLQLMFSATITVKPKQLTVQVDTKLTASVAATTSSSALTYQIITLNAVDSETVAATGTVATKPKKSSGQITIFNNYSGAPQTLISNTRFETLDGLIYRIQSPIKVPGFTTSGGKITPGSITVTVVADQNGSKYNIDMVDFSIPGFKTDTNRYSKIFARSKTAMTGGSDGNPFGVSESTRQAAQAVIESRLKDNLLRQVQSQKTADSVIFDAASKISFQNLADTAGNDTGHIVVNERGTISSVVFDKKTLGKLLFSDETAAVGNTAEILGIENLHFIAAVSSTSSVWQSKPFTFTLTGPVDVVGVVDTNKLLQDIAGVARSDLAKILLNYPTIDKATATIKPFWKSSFPIDISKIKVEIAK
jgi:hypothetical protein